MIGVAQSLSPERVDVDEASSINGLIITLHVHAVKKEQSLAMPSHFPLPSPSYSAQFWELCTGSGAMPAADGQVAPRSLYPECKEAPGCVPARLTLGL